MGKGLALTKAQRGSLTWATALFLLSSITISSIMSLNASRAEDTRVNAKLLAEDINVLVKALAIHYQITCDSGLIPLNTIVGTYIPDIRRPSYANDYTLSIIPGPMKRAVNVIVSVDITPEQTRYTSKAISEGAVLNNGSLTKSTSLTLNTNSRVSIVHQTNDTQSVGSC